jgi:uncharacterized membrane protein
MEVKDENKEIEHQNTTQVIDNRINESAEINEIDDFVKRIENFKKDVSEHRKKLSKDESFKDVDKDHQYKVLMDKSAFAIEDDDEVDYSKYPFGHTLRRYKEEERVDDPEYPTIDFDKISHKEYKRVYLKAFYEEDETPTLEMENLEGTNKKELARKFLAKQQKDIEAFIYEDVINKVGILIMTVGVLFLVSQGIEVGILGETHRLLIGGIFAGILVFSAHQLKDKNPTFSVLFITSGLTILYYTSYLAYNDYQLVPQFVAFVVKIFITALALFFAVYHNRRSLAIIALLGGYSTPFLVRANEHYESFFIYLFVINLLIMGIAYIKNWDILNKAVFVCTVIFFDLWVTTTSIRDSDSGFFLGCVLFSTLFFLQFFVMMVVRTLRPYIAANESQLSGWDYTIFFANFALYYLTILHALRQTGLIGEYLGLFGIALGIFHAIFVVFIKPHPRQDSQLTNYALFIALGLITFSSTIYVDSPLQLNFFWVVEAIILLWIARKSKIQLLTDASSVVMGLGIVTLFVVWSRVYYFNTNIDITAFFNNAVYGSFFTVIALGFTISLLLKMGKNSMVLTFTSETYTGILGGLLIFIVYVTGAIELNYHPFTNHDLTRLIIGIYNGIFVTLFWFWADRNSVGKVQRTAEYVMVFMIASYLFYGHPSTIELRNRFLAQDPATPLSHFMTHYINVIIAFLGMYLMLVSNYRKVGETNSEFASMLWAACVVAVFHLSAELDHLMVLVNYNPSVDSLQTMDDLLRDTHRTLYPILWGLISFWLMYAGMRYKIKALRMMSLVLFAAILLKFFVLDFWRIATFPRIISLIFIGGLLLFISYLYNQLRIMILEGELDTEAIKAVLQGKQVKVNEVDKERFHARNVQKEQSFEEQNINDEHKKNIPPTPFVPPSKGLDDE